MINVVTWIDDDKYRPELSAVCAGKGIRIIANEFTNHMDFLRRFDAIDANVDVLVISHTKIENIDKKRFFEEVCVTEPNIRIVIVFPGYRNEYIEAQITEYKELGIFEIIYEGQRLDSDYFVEVIKKGYIYDYEVNVYDEKDEKIKTFKKKSDCVTIGIMGATHGCGVTNMAISIAEYISFSENCNVKVIDFSGTGSLRFARSKKVTFIVHSDIDIDRIKRTSRIVIIDFGTPLDLSAKGRLLGRNGCYSDERMNLFKNCNLKVCMCFADDWHIGKLKYFLNDKEWRSEINNSYLFLLDSVPKGFRSKHSRVNIYGRNETAVSDTIAELLVSAGGG